MVHSEGPSRRWLCMLVQTVKKAAKKKVAKKKTAKKKVVKKKVGTRFTHSAASCARCPPFARVACRESRRGRPPLSAVQHRRECLASA